MEMTAEDRATVGVDAASARRTRRALRRAAGGRRLHEPSARILLTRRLLDCRDAEKGFVSQRPFGGQHHGVPRSYR